MSNSSTSATGVSRLFRLRLMKPIAFLALACIVGAAAAVGAGIHGGADQLGHPANAAAHVERMLQHVYIEIDASDAQKARLDPIFKQAAAELMPLRDQFHNGRTQMLALLGEDTIDRAAIETIRAQHLQMADQASRTLVKVVADAAEVLTPAQRKILLDRIAQHHPAGHG